MLIFRDCGPCYVAGSPALSRLQKGTGLELTPLPELSASPLVLGSLFVEIGPCLLQAGTAARPGRDWERCHQH